MNDKRNERDKGIAKLRRVGKEGHACKEAMPCDQKVSKSLSRSTADKKAVKTDGERRARNLGGIRLKLRVAELELRVGDEGGAVLVEGAEALLRSSD